MEDVRVDRDGQLRCWNCGATQFSERRTGTFWAVVIIGGALTIGILALIALVFVKPKLQCRICGQWSRPGHAVPHGPRPQTPADHLPRRKT